MATISSVYRVLEAFSLNATLIFTLIIILAECYNRYSFQPVECIIINVVELLQVHLQILLMAVCRQCCSLLPPVEACGMSLVASVCMSVCSTVCSTITLESLDIKILFVQLQDIWARFVYEGSRLRLKSLEQKLFFCVACSDSEFQMP